MANILNRNPIYIDTAFQSYKAAVAATLGTLFTLIVTRVLWVGPVAIGDEVIIDDPHGGAQLLLLRNTVTNGPDIERDYSASPLLWADFGVPQMPAGSKLFIYTK
ncbi:MAG: hypothetical protein ACYDHE_11200 [Candidatus Acidiferrales bacterium]